MRQFCVLNNCEFIDNVLISKADIWRDGVNLWDKFPLLMQLLRTTAKNIVEKLFQ